MRQVGQLTSLLINFLINLLVLLGLHSTDAGRQVCCFEKIFRGQDRGHRAQRTGGDSPSPMVVEVSNGCVLNSCWVNKAINVNRNNLDNGAGRFIHNSGMVKINLLCQEEPLPMQNKL